MASILHGDSGADGVGHFSTQLPRLPDRPKHPFRGADVMRVPDRPALRRSLNDDRTQSRTLGIAGDRDRAGRVEPDREMGQPFVA
jgi:hypothetical protein